MLVSFFKLWFVSQRYATKKALLFQNSMRATVELYEDKKEAYPSVKTLVTLGKEDLSIKVTTLFAHIFYQLI